MTKLKSEKGLQADIDLAVKETKNKKTPVGAKSWLNTIYYFQIFWIPEWS